MKVSAIIQIRDGKLVNKNAVRDLFKALQDGRHLLEISKKNKRTLSQNDYYWLIMTEYIQPALYDLGWRDIKSKDDAHDFCRALFLKVKVVNEVTGDERTRIKSTTELSTVEFNEYLEEIWQWSAEFLGINVPEPNQQLQCI